MQFDHLTWVPRKSVGHANGITFKFCHGRYGDAVHRAFAANGLAPELLSVDKLGTTQWIRVQMAFLQDYKSLDKYSENETSNSRRV
jgi:hypothetical protein